MIKIIFRRILAPCTVFLCIGIATAQDSDLEAIFHDSGIRGTMILSSFDGKNEFIFNKERANKRFLPASTFKIPNSLIALDEIAIAGHTEIIKWDGEDKGWEVWNKDQTLETAFPISCVWFYQELAKRIGDSNYLSHLEKLNYGNKKTGPELTTFWLDGDLKISAREQIAFLRRLHKNALPYKKGHMQILKRIMIVEKQPEYTIRAKTGWAMRIEKQHGWYVGYVETGKTVWFFAMNMDIKKKSDAGHRKAITMKALEKKGII